MGPVRGLSGRRWGGRFTRGLIVVSLFVLCTGTVQQGQPRRVLFPAFQSGQDVLIGSKPRSYVLRHTKDLGWSSLPIKIHLPRLASTHATPEW